MAVWRPVDVLKKKEKPRFGFPRANRLLKRGSFVRLSRRGKRIQDTHFILCYSPGETDAVRLGITVTKKVGSAVRRNRIKRLCREFFRCNRLRIKTSADINLIAKWQAGGCDNAGIRCSLERVFKPLIG